MACHEHIRVVARLQRLRLHEFVPLWEEVKSKTADTGLRRPALAQSDH